MTYVPNLIPEKSRVLPNYFKGTQNTASGKKPNKDALMWTLGIPILFVALVSIAHPLLFLVLGFAGFVLIPPGHKLLEHKLSFQLTNKIKTITCGMLLILALPLGIRYADADKETALQQQLLQEQTAKEKAITAHKEQQREDSLIYYIEQSRQLSRHHKIDEANEQLKRAMVFATASESDLLAKEKTSIAAVRTSDLIKAGKYRDALPEIDALLTVDPSNSDLLYNRAVCYSKTGNIKEAVNDLMPLVKAGNAYAEKLYNKINPIRKKIVGYETLCCDGSMSSARGRGACSHHGGVCDWNHPIYEEYRKYE